MRKKSKRKNDREKQRITPTSAYQHQDRPDVAVICGRSPKGRCRQVELVIPYDGRVSLRWLIELLSERMVTSLERDRSSIAHRQDAGRGSAQGAGGWRCDVNSTDIEKLQRSADAITEAVHRLALMVEPGYGGAIHALTERIAALNVELSKRSRLREVLARLVQASWNYRLYYVADGKKTSDVLEEVLRSVESELANL